MPDAKSLFKRHWSEFEKEKDLGWQKAVIFAACIVAEAIRNGLDDTTQ